MTDEPSRNGRAGPDDADRALPLQLTNLRADLAQARTELEQCYADARAAREREVVLRHEMQHRVRNTLALVRSVFSRTVDSGAPLEDLAAHFTGRLDVLARYQLAGALDPRRGVDLESMIRDELRNFAFGDLPGIVIEGPAVMLAPDHVQPVALAIHELVTNALKFGALAVDRATLSVTWSVENEVLALTWAESGVPVVAAAPQRRGFSREFIEEALPYQISAETRFDIRPGGVLCRIHLPLRAHDRAPGG